LIGFPPTCCLDLLGSHTNARLTLAFAFGCGFFQINRRR